MRRLSLFLIIGGVLVLVAGALWKPVVEPKLVKFPSNSDLTMHYSGALMTYQVPGQQLATALQTPLQIDRRVQTISNQTGANTAIVRDTMTVKTGNDVKTQTQVYAIDRRSMENVANNKAWSLVPSNVVNRSGSYTIQLPMNLSDKGSQFKIYNEQTGASYNLMKVEGSTTKLNGLDVYQLEGGYPFTPVTAAEQAALAAQGLPMQLTPDEMVAQLKAAGVDVNQALTGLSQVLTPQEMATVTAAFSAPVPLQYYAYGSGQATAGNKTGMIVAVKNAIDGIAVKPDLSGLQPVIAVLHNHAGVTAIDTATATLTKLAAASPQRVYELRYSQTAGSITDMTKEAKRMTRQANLATTDAPRGLYGLGGLLVIAGLITFFISRKHRHAPVTAMPVTPPIEETPTGQRPAA